MNTPQASEKTVTPLTKKDFMSDQEVRWCPGCGDYSILAQTQRVMPDLGIPKHKTVFVSGIGCSSRFPYYMNTYGFHTIHGRATAVATGVKVANPKLDVWVISGDGDALSIGGNHFIHALRRNIGFKLLVLNNEIYGLTKGQYSPTTKQGSVTKSSPYGAVDRTFSPAALGLGANATFYARAVDTNPKLLTEVILAAAQHRGTSFVEILQNCVIFNDKCHHAITSKETRADNQLLLQHGKPMLFGANNNKGIILRGTELIVGTLGERGITEKDILIHDAHAESPNLAFMLSQLNLPHAPVPLGIIRQISAPTYEDSVCEQIARVKASKGVGDFDKLLHSGDTWEVG